MKAGARYWVMLAVLLGATIGMAYLSHGETTPPAKPLSRPPPAPPLRKPLAADTYINSSELGL